MIKGAPPPLCSHNEQHDALKLPRSSTGPVVADLIRLQTPVLRNSSAVKEYYGPEQIPLCCEH